MPSNVVAIKSSIGVKPLAPAPAEWSALGGSVFPENPTIGFLLLLAMVSLPLRADDSLDECEAAALAMVWPRMMRKGYMSAYVSQFPQPAPLVKVARRPTDGIETSRRSFFRHSARLIRQSGLTQIAAVGGDPASRTRFPVGGCRESAQSCATSRFLTHSVGLAAVMSSLEAEKRLLVGLNLDILGQFERQALLGRM